MPVIASSSGESHPPVVFEKKKKKAFVADEKGGNQSDFNCQDNGNPYNHFGTYAPGFSDLSVNGFNDQISSYYCNPN